jgi:hypothetical protein
VKPLVLKGWLRRERNFYSTFNFSPETNKRQWGKARGTTKFHSSALSPDWDETSSQTVLLASISVTENSVGIHIFSHETIRSMLSTHTLL